MSLLVYHYHGAPRPREISVARHQGDHALSKKKIAENHDEKIARLFPTAIRMDNDASPHWLIDTDLQTFADRWQEKFAVYVGDTPHDWRVFITPYNSFGAR